MKFQRNPTRTQVVMIVLMATAFLALTIWAIPELVGVLSPESEDTYSEWVWDLPLWAVLTIATLHVIAGVLLVWSAGHFLEGYSARRKQEKRSRP